MSSFTLSKSKALPLSLIACAVLSSIVQAEDVETMVVTSSILKVDIPMEEAPRSMSVVDRSELDTHQVQKLDEALRYRSGVLSAPYGADNDTDWIKIRGFDAATYLDGNRLFKDGYYSWTIEPFGLERIEVLKGPASILYGEAPPGGVVNAVSKRPTATPQGLVNIQMGNRDHKQLGIDISGDASESGDVRYRVVAMANERNGVLDGTYNKRFYLAPSLTMDFSDRTTLTLLASIKEDKGVPTNGFFPAYGSLIDTEFGKVNPSTNLGEPGYDINENKQISLAYEFSHIINDTWEIKQNTRYGHTDLLLRSSYVFPSDSSHIVQRGLVYREGTTDSLAMDTQAEGNWYGENSEQMLLLGVDLQGHKNKSADTDDYAFGQPINIFDHKYGNYTPIDTSKATQREITKQQAGAYVQYQLRLVERWVMTVGGRYDYVDTENRNNSAQTVEQGSDNNVSVNAGLLYIAANGLSPYVSYAESFEVIATVDPATNKLYKPLEGQQIEVGIKYTPEFMDGYLNLALFDLIQQNSLVTNPDTWVKTQTGEVTSQGVEIEGVGYLTDNFKLTASYTFTDAKTDESGGQGTQQAGMIPRHLASAWGDYDFSGMVNGLQIGAGARYIGDSVDNPASSDRSVPSHTVFDAMLSYQISKQWQAQINFTNLADEVYVSSCDYYCYYGEPRSVIGSVSYRW